jgi:hypothetical protein
LELQNMIYEVEFRCHFESADEAYQYLPFLRAGLQRRCTWDTAIYGLEYFKSGGLIRMARVSDDKLTKYFIGWKGPDRGTFANIRQEVGEEITPPSTRSSILGFLGGSPEIKNRAEAVKELERLGYCQFMQFEGEDISGYYQPDDLYLKLMTCRELQWPLIVEIEKNAGSLEEALRCERSLKALCQQYGLEKRVIKEEPPTLLYRALYGSKPTPHQILQSPGETSGRTPPG